MTLDIRSGTIVVTSAGWNDTEMPALSIVVPFYQYDPRPLILDLAAKMSKSSERIELILLDDGSPDTCFFDAVATALAEVRASVKVVRSHRNLGRSEARNGLVEFSRAPFLIFLDSDMLPDDADYLERYIAEIRAGTALAYGGRSVSRCRTVKAQHQLHWYFTKRFEQVPAAIRSSDPAIYFLSSNFLVRRDIIKAIPLDARFSGWGWEDCEWAHRVGLAYTLKHIDNPATHLGLIDLASIKKKYQESVANFALILHNCPALVQGTVLLKVTELLAKWHLGRVTEMLTEALLDRTWLPLSARSRLLQFYKASLYSRVIP